MRTTEDVLYLVSPSLREAGLALGISHYKVFFYIILKTARAGVITGVMLSFARIFGETAPLLFTALNNDFTSFNLMQPNRKLTSGYLQLRIKSLSGLATNRLGRSIADDRVRRKLQCVC